MKTLEGTPSRRFAPIIGEIALRSRPFYARSRAILVTPRMDRGALGYRACLTSGPAGRFFHPDHLFGVDGLEQLGDGDIVRLDSAGKAHVLWETGSAHNALLVTEACNCSCLMCPQPPRAHDPALLCEARAVLDLLRGRSLTQLCLTGGEPTLLGEDFVALLRRCVREHPEARIDILTNGKAFADRRFAARVGEAATPNVLFCVSLHSEIDMLHDTLTGAPGSYIATQQGIYHLAEQGCRIEIRHVISRKNAQFLESFAEHLYNYFPFCAHYVFMGMELCGNAACNSTVVAVAPYEYQQQLRAAVLALARRGLPVSVYNIPLCLCAPEIRPFLRQSIASWKNIYPPQCDSCERKEACAGFFGTSASLPLDHIHPLKKEEVCFTPPNDSATDAEEPGGCP